MTKAKQETIAQMRRTLSWHIEEDTDKCIGCKEQRPFIATRVGGEKRKETLRAQV
jgi:hypothetical protein